MTNVALGSSDSLGAPVVETRAAVRLAPLVLSTGAAVALALSAFLPWASEPGAITATAWDANLPWLVGGSDLAQQTAGSIAGAWVLLAFAVLVLPLLRLVAQSRRVAGTPLMVLGVIVVLFVAATRYRFVNQFLKIDNLIVDFGAGMVLATVAGVVLIAAGLFVRLGLGQSAVALGGPITIEALSGDRERLDRETAVRWTLFAAGAMSVVISLAIVLMLGIKVAPFIRDVDWGTVWSTGWFPRNFTFDIKTLFMATLITTLIAMAVAQPIGLGVAIYLSEYARPGVRRWLKPVIEVLAGIPTVVFGAFAFSWISPQIVQRFTDANQGNLAAAGIGVGILLIPLIASVSEDALSAVPRPLREASAGLGARKATTSIKVVVPAAISGLVAAFILGISRGFGETMIVFLAGGAADTAVYTHNPLDGGLTMTAAMAGLAVGTDNVAVASGGEGMVDPVASLYFVGTLLFLLTLALNLAANRFVRRIREAY